jgi:20S proteasome alpha/beta subunit
LTVAIGLVCSDGVIVASDSMASDGRIARDQQKVNALSRLPVVWTASGSVYVIEEVTEELVRMEDAVVRNPVQRGHFATPDCAKVRDLLGHHVRDKMRTCYQAAMPTVGKADSVTGLYVAFPTDFLLLGFGTSGAFFLEIARDGQLNWHTVPRFYAVGSAGDFAKVANGLMKHYLEGEPLSVELGLQLAYRTIETTCSVSSSGVGLPVQLAVADANGARVLTTEQIEPVKAAVAGWKKLEAETLRKRPDEPTAPLEQPPQLSPGG